MNIPKPESMQLIKLTTLPFKRMEVLPSGEDLGGASAPPLGGWGAGLAVLLLITISHLAHAQQSYRTERSTFDITTSVGFADKNTRDHFGTAFSAGLRKEWSVGKLISLNAAAD